MRVVRPGTGSGLGSNTAAGRRSRIVLRRRNASRCGSRPRRRPRSLAWREHLRAGPLVIAAAADRPASTVGKVLRRAGCSRLPQPPTRSAHPVRARPSRRTLARRHQETRPLPPGRQADPPRRRAAQPPAPAGSTCTSRSTTTRLAYTELLPSERKEDCAAFLTRALSPGTPSKGSPWSECSATTPRPTTPTAGATPATNSASAAAKHAPLLALDKTGKPKPSSKPCSASGPTASPTPRAHTAAKHSPATSGGTNRRRPHGSLAGQPPTSRVSHLCGQYT